MDNTSECHKITVLQNSSVIQLKEEASTPPGLCETQKLTQVILIMKPSWVRGKPNPVGVQPTHINPLALGLDL